MWNLNGQKSEIVNKTVSGYGLTGKKNNLPRL